MPAANVPLRVCGRRRQPPATAPLRPQRGSLPNCPAAPIPPSHCGNSVVGLAGASGPKVSNVVGFLQAPHCRGRCAQFPRPRRPQAAKSGRASVRASGQGYFSETFLPHHRSSGRRNSLWKACSPPQRTLRCPRSSGGLARKD